MYDMITYEQLCYGRQISSESLYVTGETPFHRPAGFSLISIVRHMASILPVRLQMKQPTLNTTDNKDLHLLRRQGNLRYRT